MFRILSLGPAQPHKYVECWSVWAFQGFRASGSGFRVLGVGPLG